MTAWGVSCVVCKVRVCTLALEFESQRIADAAGGASGDLALNIVADDLPRDEDGSF